MGESPWKFESSRPHQTVPCKTWFSPSGAPCLRSGAVPQGLAAHPDSGEARDCRSIGFTGRKGAGSEAGTGIADIEQNRAQALVQVPSLAKIDDTAKVIAKCRPVEEASKWLLIACRKLLPCFGRFPDLRGRGKSGWSGRMWPDRRQLAKLSCQTPDGRQLRQATGSRISSLRAVAAILSATFTA